MTDEKVCIDEDIFAKSLCMMFSVEWLRDAARRTGFIKRERKIMPEIFSGFLYWDMDLFYRGHLPA